MTGSVLRLTALALIGVAIAAGAALAISRLVSQDIGLQSEPLSAGDRLAPPAAAPPAGEREGRGRSGHDDAAPREERNEGGGDRDD